MKGVGWAGKFCDRQYLGGEESVYASLFGLRIINYNHHVLHESCCGCKSWYATYPTLSTVVYGTVSPVDVTSSDVSKTSVM